MSAARSQVAPALRRKRSEQQHTYDLVELRLADRHLVAHEFRAAIIGYAELLCENADAYGLAARAKEAVARRVHEMNFGGRPECEDYMVRVRKAQAAVVGQKQITVIVKTKMERLRAICEYRNSADTVPTADSLATSSVRASRMRRSTISSSTDCPVTSRAARATLALVLLQE